jgi:hypothetical protein
LRQAVQAQGGVLQQAVGAAREPQKLLGFTFARQGPQAGAGAAAEDDGDEGGHEQTIQAGYRSANSLLRTKQPMILTAQRAILCEFVIGF